VTIRRSNGKKNPQPCSLLLHECTRHQQRRDCEHAKGATEDGSEVRSPEAHGRSATLQRRRHVAEHYVRGARNCGPHYAGAPG
jgi:hypothetical protein